MYKKVAGIVVYNPDIARLKQNIDAIYPQVDTLIIANNGVQSGVILEQLLMDYERIKIIGDGDNIGIAAALNLIAQCAIGLGAEWLLTLDQDSVCNNSLIQEYERYTSERNVALLTCRIKDRNFNLNQGNNNEKGLEYISNCITSGSYIRLSVLKEIGGFDEKMFIDSVDTDYCYRLTIQDYQIARVPYYGLLHEIGQNTKELSLLGKKIVIFNHSPFRCYYIIRNQIYFARKHRDTLGRRVALRRQRTAWTRILIYLLFEKDKWKKTCAWITGLHDGYVMPIKK